MGTPSSQRQIRIDGPGEFAIDIVGESNYQQELDVIAGGKNESGHNKLIEVRLILEDDNPHDDRAVAVFVGDQIVGHLDRKMARLYREQLSAAGIDRAVIVCDARIVGGWDRGDVDVGYYGLKLDLPFK